jgi:undecaprenyl-diphosphatase
LTRQYRLTLIGLLSATIGLFLAMHFGYLASFDDGILRLPRQVDDQSQLLGGAKLGQAVSDLTALGGLTILFSLTLIISLYFMVVEKFRLAAVLVGTVVSGWMLSASIKVLVGRARPEVVPHLIPVHDASFPSGHALVSAVTYLTLGMLLASVQKRRCAKLYVMGVAICLTLLVGLSRIFLGVHFPSDVLAGWLLGAAWSMICVSLAQRYILNERK